MKSNPSKCISNEDLIVIKLHFINEVVINKSKDYVNFKSPNASIYCYYKLLIINCRNYYEKWKYWWIISQINLNSTIVLKFNLLIKYKILTKKSKPGLKYLTKNPLITRSSIAILNVKYYIIAILF